VKKVRDSDLFKINMSTLHEPRLERERLFINLRNRLESFYILAEKYRLQGPTSQQRETCRKTGYKFEYHVELHKCLKDLVQRVIN